MYIIIVGTLVGGLRFFGPWLTFEEADEAGRKLFRYEEWTAVEIETPKEVD